MKPGPELDALIAEKIMGIKVHEQLGEDFYFIFDGEVLYKGLKYSTDISAAWEVVEKLRKDGLRLSLISDLTSKSSHGLDFRWNAYFHTNEVMCRVEYFVNTAPHAICLAALKSQEGLL